MTTEITMPEKDCQRLNAMVVAIMKKPESASEFLSYAYGLGFCEGRTVTAKEFLATINEHSPNAAPSVPEEKK